MSIMMNPSEVAKVQSASGEPIKPEEVCLRAVSLLKNIILTSWVIEEEEDDKENTQSTLNSSQQPQNQF